MFRTDGMMGTYMSLESGPNANNALINNMMDSDPGRTISGLGVVGLLEKMRPEYSPFCSYRFYEIKWRAPGTIA